MVEWKVATSEFRRDPVTSLRDMSFRVFMFEYGSYVPIVERVQCRVGAK